MSTLTCKTHRHCWTDPWAVDRGRESYESSWVLFLHHFTPKPETQLRCQSGGLSRWDFFFFHYKLPETVTATTQQWEETKTHNHCHSAAGAAWLCCRGQTLFFGQKYDEESVKRTGGSVFFFLGQVAKDTTTRGLKCASFLFYLMSGGSVWLSGWTTIRPTHPDGLSIHTDSVSPLLWLRYCLRWQTGGGDGRWKLKMSELSPNSLLIVNNVGQITSLNTWLIKLQQSTQWNENLLFSSPIL